MVLIVSKGDGFSLIELIVTMALFAIVLAIAIPQIATFKDGAKARGVAQELYGNFHKAKTEAVKRNQIVRMLFNLAGNGSYQMYVDNNGDATLDGGEPVLVAVSLPQEVKLQNSTFAGNQVGFNNRGLPAPSGSGSIQIADTSGNVKSTLSTSFAGYIHVE